MRQGVRAIEHHKEEILAAEDSCPEAEGEEEMYDVTYVVNGDIYNGISLIRDQQTSAM